MAALHEKWKDQPSLIEEDWIRNRIAEIASENKFVNVRLLGANIRVRWGKYDYENFSIYNLYRIGCPYFGDMIGFQKLIISILHENKVAIQTSLNL